MARSLYTLTSTISLLLYALVLVLSQSISGSVHAVAAKAQLGESTRVASHGNTGTIGLTSSFIRAARQYYGPEWGEEYLLDPKLVKSACEEFFCTGKRGSKCSAPVYTRSKHKLLVVFLPDDGVFSQKDEALGIVQSSIFSALVSGTFDRNAEVAFITSRPRQNGGDVHVKSSPLHVFRASSVCESLASRPTKSMNLIDGMGIVEYILKSQRNVFPRPKTPMDLEEVEFPLTLAWTWYQLLSMNPEESKCSPDGTTLSKISNFVHKQIVSGGHLEPNDNLLPVIHPQEVNPSWSMIGESVAMVFGDNDVFLSAIAAGRLGSNSLDSEHSWNFDVKEIVHDFGMIEVQKKYKSGDKGGKPDVFPYPLMCPSIMLNGSVNSLMLTDPKLEGRTDLRLLGGSYGGLCAPAGCKYYTNNHQFSINARMYPGYEKLGTYETAVYPESYLGFSSMYCQGTHTANIMAADLIASLSPSKIIQIEVLNTNPNKEFKYNGDSQIELKDEVLPSTISMGCPDLLLSSTPDGKFSNAGDMIIDSFCNSKSVHPNPATKELRCSAFSQIYASTFNNQSVTMTGFRDENGRCHNAVLTLHINTDSDSDYNLYKVSKFYTTIIKSHLNEACNSNSERIEKAKFCSLYSKSYVYDSKTDTTNVLGGNTHVTAYPILQEKPLKKPPPSTGIKPDISTDTSGSTPTVSNSPSTPSTGSNSPSTPPTVSSSPSTPSTGSSSPSTPSTNDPVNTLIPGGVNTGNVDNEEKVEDKANDNALYYGIAGAMAGLVFISTGGLIYNRLSKKRANKASSTTNNQDYSMHTNPLYEGSSYASRSQLISY